MRNRRSVSRNRLSTGATLALVAASIAVIIAIGVAFFLVSQLIGGSRELRNATNSGNLNIAKQAIKNPGINLNQGVEADNFGGLLDDNNEIDLLTYNRAVGQTLLVACNAQAEKTTQAAANAASLVKVLQLSPTGLGKRLQTALVNPSNTNNFFSSLAMGNSLRMLGSNTLNNQSYDTSYMEHGGATNVFLDPSILPNGATLPPGAFSSQSSASGYRYLSGYQQMDLSKFNLPSISFMSGVSVQPDLQPHLVSSSEFVADQGPPLAGCALPPNAFKSVASSKDNTSRTDVGVQACSEVGTLSSTFPASIPRGYLVINNPSGLNLGPSLPSNDSIYNNELFTGIYLADNGAFSTDPTLISQWAAYNSTKQGAPPPTTGLFGDPNTIKSAGTECNYTNVNGPGALPVCAANLPAFEKAYPSSNSTPGTAVPMTAVEAYKQSVMNAFPNPGNISVPSNYTGMRVFNHGQAYPVPAGQNAQFTTPGTIPQLLNQVSSQTATTVLAQLKQRMREIKPDATPSELNAVLSSQSVNLGQTMYIYMINKELTLTNVPPAWIVQNTQADGSPQDYSIQYPTLGLSVNPVGESGFRNVLFEGTPDPATTTLGQDEALFTPSSGFNNLLGTLEFRNQIVTPLPPVNNVVAVVPSGGPPVPNGAPPAPGSPGSVVPGANTTVPPASGKTGGNLPFSALPPTGLPIPSGTQVPPGAQQGGNFRNDGQWIWYYAPDGSQYHVDPAANAWVAN